FASVEMIDPPSTYSAIDDSVDTTAITCGFVSTVPPVASTESEPPASPCLMSRYAPEVWRSKTQIGLLVPELPTPHTARVKAVLVIEATSTTEQALSSPPIKSDASDVVHTNTSSVPSNTNPGRPLSAVALNVGRASAVPCANTCPLPVRSG